MNAKSALVQIRQAEIERVRPYFEPGKRVLELGGGNGYQASVLSSWGLSVDSIDIEPREPSHFPVLQYDGSHIPFEDGRFDYVYSSNVLEHIRDLETVFREMRRVARNGARFIHVLPTPAWRLWTNVAHYPYLVRRYLLRNGANDSSIAMPASVGDAIGRRGIGYTIKRALLPAAHGEYASSIAELYYFSARRWSRTFRENGFAVVERQPVGVFYTGYEMFPRLSIDARRRMAGLIGSACNLFVLERAS